MLRERLPTPSPPLAVCPTVAPARAHSSSVVHRLGGGKSRVAGEDTPSCSASVCRPPSLRSTLGQMVFGVNSCAPARGRQKSRRGRGYAPVLRERLPTPEPYRHPIRLFVATAIPDPF